MGKKNQFIWFLYACVLLFSFSRTTALLTQMMGLSAESYLLLTAALLCAVLLLVYLPVKAIAQNRSVSLTGPVSDRGRKMTALSWGCLLFLLAVLFFVRFCGAPAGSAVEGQFCYREALKGGRTAPKLSAGGLYIRLLGLCVGVCGSDAVFGCNLALQALGAVFLFWAARGFAGIVPACCALLAAVFVPAFHNSAYAAEPQSLVFFLWALLLFFTDACMRRRSFRGKKKGGEILLCLPAAVCGFAAAFCAALGSVWLLAAAELFAGLKGKKRMRRVFAGSIVCALSGFLIFFFLTYILEPESRELLSKWTLFWENWHPGSARICDAVLHSPALWEYWTVIPLYLLAFLCLFGTGRPTKKSGVCWILPLVWAMGTDLAGRAPYQEQGISFILLGIMSGYGMTQMFVVPADRKGEENDMGTEELKIVFEDSEEKKSARRPRPGEYLENPLPVPKRHVKKEMDYGFDPGPDQMFFEIPVSEDDDFDLK